MKHQFEPRDPYHLTDKEIDDLALFSGTYEEHATEQTKSKWREVYRKVENETNQQILKHGSVNAWYESGEGRLL